MTLSRGHVAICCNLSDVSFEKGSGSRTDAERSFPRYCRSR